MKTTYMQYCQLEVFTAKAKTEERYLSLYTAESQFKDQEDYWWRDADAASGW